LSVTVKNNETGAESKISGDPHFDVGTTARTTSTSRRHDLKLDDGTKITIGPLMPQRHDVGLEPDDHQCDNSIQVTGLGADKDGAITSRLCSRCRRDRR